MIDINIRRAAVNLYRTLGNNGIIGIKRENTIINTFKTEENKKLFHINSLYNWLKDIKIKKRKYTNYKITDEIDKFVIEYITNNVLTSTLNVKKIVNEKFKTNLSKSCIYCIIRKNNLTYKKCKTNVNRNSLEKQKEQIKKVSDEIKKVDINNIISIDEMSIHLNEKSNYGWSKKGTPCVYNDKKAIVNNKRLSLLMATSNKQPISYLITEGSINSLIFLDFMKTLKNKNNVYFLDNCSIHHAKIFKEYIDTEKINVIYNAPYHSEFNPIENVFSMIRREIKNNINHTIEHVKNIVSDFTKINNIDKYKNIFNHCFKELHEYK